jgi:hypothetical protein
MTPLLLGIEISAYVGVALIIGAVVATTCAFLQAQTQLLKASLTDNKNPHAHLHPFTQSVLDGSCEELRQAQKAIGCGDLYTARVLVDEIVMMLDAEKDSCIRNQLQTKLKKAVSRAVPQRERRAVAVQQPQCKRIASSSQVIEV